MEAPVCMVYVLFIVEKHDGGGQSVPTKGNKTKKHIKCDFESCPVMFSSQSYKQNHLGMVHFKEQLMAKYDIASLGCVAHNKAFKSENGTLGRGSNKKKSPSRAWLRQNAFLMPACLLACLPVCLPVCLPLCLHAVLLAVLGAVLLASLLTCPRPPLDSLECL